MNDNDLHNWYLDRTGVPREEVDDDGAYYEPDVDDNEKWE